MGTELHLRVGKVAQQFGVTAGMLRHYEAMGLLDPPRDSHGDRLFGAADVTRLEVVIALSRAGVPLATIATVLNPGNETETLHCSILAEQIKLLEFRQSAIAAALGVLRSFL